MAAKKNKKEYLKPGASVFCDGVFLRLEPNGSWTLMGIEGDTYCDGANVSGVSVMKDENHPYIGDDEEEDE